MAKVGPGLATGMGRKGKLLSVSSRAPTLLLFLVPHAATLFFPFPNASQTLGGRGPAANQDPFAAPGSPARGQAAPARGNAQRGSVKAAPGFSSADPFAPQEPGKLAPMGKCRWFETAACTARGCAHLRPHLLSLAGASPWKK